MPSFEWRFPPFEKKSPYVPHLLPLLVSTSPPSPRHLLPSSFPPFLTITVVVKLPQPREAFFIWSISVLMTWALDKEQYEGPITPLLF